MDASIVLAVLVKEAMLRKLALSPRLNAIGQGMRTTRYRYGGDLRRQGNAGRSAFDAQRSDSIHSSAKDFVKKHQTAFEEKARRHPEDYQPKRTHKPEPKPGAGNSDSGNTGKLLGAGLAVGGALAAKKLHSMWKARRAVKP